VKWITRFFKSQKNGVTKSDSPLGEDLTADAAPAYGRELKTGMIVSFASSDVSFDEALAAGPEHMMEYFAEVIFGLRIGHVRELRKLGFFSAVKKSTRLNVDIGSWEEIPAAQLPHLLEIIESITPRASKGLRNILDDLKRMAQVARDQGCSIGFMLAD
jgi:hypothetical protein